MAVSRTVLPRGIDLGPLFAGLPNDLCPCPHWGYLLEGRMALRYQDGSVEEIHAGDVYYIGPGHFPTVLEDAVSLDFSPIGPWRELLQHLAARMPAAPAPGF
ncbi:MAG: hypothetical protein FIB01_10300 [Gemmatimonadetes bacterium]|nr:hypothetical protein [Gemmatimonadota bacterium]